MAPADLQELPGDMSPASASGLQGRVHAALHLLLSPQGRGRDMPVDPRSRAEFPAHSFRLCPQALSTAGSAQPSPLPPHFEGAAQLFGDPGQVLGRWLYRHPVTGGSLGGPGSGWLMGSSLWCVVGSQEEEGLCRCPGVVGFLFCKSPPSPSSCSVDKNPGPLERRGMWRHQATAVPAGSSTILPVLLQQLAAAWE